MACWHIKAGCAYKHRQKTIYHTLIHSMFMEKSVHAYSVGAPLFPVINSLTAPGACTGASDRKQEIHLKLRIARHVIYADRSMRREAVDLSPSSQIDKSTS